MIPDLPAEIEAARASLERFVTREIDPEIDAFEARGEFPRRMVRKMGEAGFFGAAFPTALGGSELGLRAVATIAEEISRLRPEFGYCMNLHAMTCPFTILNWATEAEIARFVPSLIRGEKIGMFALTEPGGGSDEAGAMRTRAERRGDFYVLNGEKAFITCAHAAEAYRVGTFAATVTMLNAGEGTANVQRIMIAEDALGYKDADRHAIPPRFPVVEAA